MQKSTLPAYRKISGGVFFRIKKIFKKKVLNIVDNLENCYIFVETKPKAMSQKQTTDLTKKQAYIAIAIILILIALADNFQ